MSKEATPRPWEIQTGRASIGGHGHTLWVLGTAYDTEPGAGVGCAIVILPDEDDTAEARIEREATANFIRKAVNNHDALVECLDTLSLVVGLAAVPNPAERECVQEALDSARALLAKIKGE